MAGSFPPNYTPPPPTIPAEYTINYNNAKNKEALLKVCKDVSKEVAEEIAFPRIKSTKISIISYWVTGGKVYLELAAGIPSASFNKDHWITGVGQLGIQGRIDNDFSFQTGSTINVKYDASITIPGHDSFVTRIKPKNAFVYSVDPTKTNQRNDWSTDSWVNALQKRKPKSISRKLTFDDLPLWDDNLNPNRGAPVSVRGFLSGLGGWGRDDVFWYQTLHGYAKHVETLHATAQKETAAYLQALNDARVSVGLPPIKTTPDGSGGGGGGGGGGKSNTDNDKPASGSLAGIGDDTKPVIHNLPAVKEMYFRSDDLQNFKVNSGNLSKKVAEAKKLWNDSASYKGMIQSYIVPARLDTNGNWWSPIGKDGLQGENKRINTRRYGFQFQYNPSTITMAYAGAPQVDIGLETSGQDKVPLIGSSVTSSTVTFQLLINRMNDFKYLDNLISGTTEQSIADQFVANRGRGQKYGHGNFLPDLFNEVYSHTGNHDTNRKNPGTAAEISSLNDELVQIRELGTMYDIEYLLRTLLGYQLKSNLRNKFTSDIGYLGAYPVELHLGNNLRYLGIIDGFNVSHTIFNQNMVPVFSNISITFSRLPDFAKPFNEVTTKVTNKDTTKDETT